MSWQAKPDIRSPRRPDGAGPRAGRLSRRSLGHAAPVSRGGQAVMRFWRKAYTDGVTGLASMVAYNLLLSLFALALVALFVAGRLLQSASLETSVLIDLQRIFPTAAEST